jgi:hypothetical protein
MSQFPHWTQVPCLRPCAFTKGFEWASLRAFGLDSSQSGLKLTASGTFLKRSPQPSFCAPSRMSLKRSVSWLSGSVWTFSISPTRS